MKNFKVTAHAEERLTKTVISESRSETVSNGKGLFSGANTVEKVKELYESFWNDLNPLSFEIVIVETVEEINN